MKTIFPFAVCIAILLIACGKDKFQTKPTIRIKNINTDVVEQNGNLRITLESTDKEGDEGDGVITYIRIRTSVTPIPNPGTYDKIDTVNYPVPSFPKTQTKDIEVSIPYGFLDEHPIKNDTMFFKFTLRDMAGNQSDTISSKTIVAKQE
ncbi:MAG: hypothetical protein HC867_08945 [Bacteroidia bacterium]|nr:hypothetical protein [Bacteroidia bacterium]